MKYLITGISGFLGEKLAERLLSERHEVVGLARNEGKLVALKEKFPSIQIITGDVSDSWTVKRAMQGVDGVFHLSAMKSVEIAEKQVFECVKTNVQGSLTVLNESILVKPKFVIGISTDKSAQVSGIYGATKKIMEKLFEECSVLNPETKYRVVRYGNVVWSQSSFLPKWKAKMQRGEEILLTDPAMTRFFWTVDEAINLIFECLDQAKDSSPWIPDMKGVTIGTVLEAMQEVFGKCPVKVIGNRGGENMHETMGEKDKNGKLIFSNDVEQFTKDEFKEKFIIPYAKG